ncbi:MAG: TonB-dependent receptor plug domain-containing protein [Lacunisphaera sp.]|nr:TonB-dependent receptor plug domain-containing protein [Lacunisphaera sp.]
MKPNHTPIDRAQKLLAIGLAALLTTTIATAQSADTDALRRLQEENAALRKRLAAVEGQAQPAAPTTQAPAAMQPSVATAPSDPDVYVLSPFEVKSDKDFGYLKTNSATATRIGMEIQNVPMSISVISQEFLADTNARSLVDLFRYTAAASGDTRFAMRIPANEATPQGAFTMRGFQVNNLMRNGVFSYIAHNMDNVERIEMVKGPASVFFGQGYPGGVINFITKRASFGKIPTTLTHSFDSYGGTRAVVDHNYVLSDKAAIRFVGSWEDTDGERRFEFKRGFMANPSLALNPLKSGKLKVNLEMEYSETRYNRNDYDWIWSDFAGWKAAAAAGPYLASTITADAGNALGTNVVQSTTTPTLAYATYINNLRNSTGNLLLPAYTKVERGAYYTNAAGVFAKDDDFNYTARGAESYEKTKVFTATVDLTPTDWFTARYVYSKDNADHNSVGQGGAIQTPYADGIHWNVGLGNRSGYYRDTNIHNLDLVFSFDAWNMKNKFLVGAQRSTWLQQYLGGAAGSDINLAFLPGARNTTSNPDYVGANVNKYNFGGVPVNQVIRQRDGSIKPVRQIFNNYDPGFEIAPDIQKWFQDDRNALDGYAPKLTGYYLNYQGQFFKDRLTVLAGFRRENRVEKYQVQENNSPWYIYPTDAYMWADPVKYPENQWGHSIAYQKTIPLDQTGDSWMAGASFKITEALSAYASVSKIFKFNSGNIGGYFPGDEVYLVQGLLAQYASIGQTGFNYRGQTITSVSQFQQVIGGLKYDQMIPNEDGMNYEVGLKYSSPDQKIVGTVSIFSANRANRKEDDGVAQSNLNEPLNSNTDPNFIAGVNRAIAMGATYSTATSSTGRLFRVRAYDNDVQVQGLDSEVIWTPVRNFQAVINASYLPKAETISDNRPALAKAGTTGYNSLTATQKRDSDIYWNSRVENIPEYKFTVFGKYTFNQGLAGDFGRGASVGLGVRYSSETVVSRSVDWNPLAGGYQAGNYVVADLTLGLPWEINGYKIRSSLGIYNLTDKQYSEGSFAMSPSRNFVFSNTVAF